MNGFATESKKNTGIDATLAGAANHPKPQEYVDGTTQREDLQTAPTAITARIGGNPSWFFSEFRDFRTLVFFFPFRVALCSSIFLDQIG